DPATGTQHYNRVPNPLTPTVSLGDINFHDASNRPLYPTIFITNLTGNPANRAGDWQHGGAPTTHIDNLFGSWTTAHFVGTTYHSVVPAAKNDWHIGVAADNVNYGADTPTGGFGAVGTSLGFGAEVRWNVSGLHDENGLPLAPGNSYRFQVMTHDDDQNKVGGDAGENCTTLTIPSPNLTITKTADATPVDAGTGVGFQITVANNGPGAATTATAVTITDTLPSLTGITWTIASDPASHCSITGPAGSQSLACALGDMAVGASYSIHITSPTTGATSGSLPNTAYAAASNAAQVHDSATIVVQGPSLAITKTADATPVSSGTSVGFTIDVGNGGPGTATAVTVNDPLPSLAGITWTIQSQTGSACSISGPAGSQTLSCSLGNMAAGASYHVHITSPTTGATHGSLPNTASASSTNAPTVHSSATIVVNGPSLAITKTADASPVSSGTSIGFTVTVGNGGPGTATSVTVNDPLPSLTGVDWTIDSDPASHCSIGGSAPSQTLTCSIGDMAAGATYTLHITSATTAATRGSL